MVIWYPKGLKPTGWEHLNFNLTSCGRPLSQKNEEVRVGAAFNTADHVNLCLCWPQFIIPEESQLSMTSPLARTWQSQWGRDRAKKTDTLKGSCIDDKLILNWLPTAECRLENWWKYLFIKSSWTCVYMRIHHIHIYVYIYVDVYLHIYMHERWHKLWFLWKGTAMTGDTFSGAQDCIPLGLGLEAVLALLSGKNSSYNS